ncbi:MAG: glycosyltransferase family 39 protein [Bacteroidota bacterium]|nr:glycosyltransferase family 39 protein [Bacteroidota bacterium]
MEKRWIPVFFLIIVVFVFYVNTISHDYALDDKMVIQNNEFTQAGISGIGKILTTDMMAGMFGEKSQIVQGGRYRPLSMITFAVEQSLFGGNPHISHFINILLYALLVLLIYRVLQKLFPQNKDAIWSVPFIAALLYAAHPIHTEIVANIKGRDEILAMLGAFAAFWFAIRYVESKKLLPLIWAFICLFLGFMSKEIALSFVFVIPFSLWFFRIGNTRQIFMTLMPVLAAAIVYVIIRISVLGQLMGEESGQLMNNPFLHADAGEKYATIFMTLGMYLKLLVFPHPLTWDYYPYHVELIQWADWRAILPLLLSIGLLALAVIGLKNRKIYAWAIWFYAATLAMTSNLIINIGAFMSERFMFFPSLAFVLLIAVLIVRFAHISKQNRQIVSIVLLILLSLYALKSISRNQVWENSYTLFQNDVEISSNSAKGNSSWGSELYAQAEEFQDTAKRNALMRQAIPYFEKAIDIHPRYVEPLVRMGNVQIMVYQDVEAMMDYYIRVLEISPENSDVWGNTYGVLSQNVDMPKFEIKTWKRIEKINQNHPELYRELGNLYLNKMYRTDSAVFYLEKAETLAPNNVQTLRMLGFAYGTMNRPVKARSYFMRLVEQNPNDAESLKFIGISYGIEGQHENAIEYLEKSLKINPNDEQAKANLNIARQMLN